MNSGNKNKSNITYFRKRLPAILVVEHQILTRVAICESLREWGFKVYEASSGEEAVTLLESRKIAVGFVIVDLDMDGEIDGLDLAALIRERLPEIVVLLASSNRKKSALAADLDLHFIAKPYDMRKVLIIIRGTMPRRR